MTSSYIARLCERLDSAYERQSNARDRETITLSKDTLEHQAAEIKQLRVVLADLVGYVEVNFDSPIDEIALIAPRAAITGEEQ